MWITPFLWRRLWCWLHRSCRLVLPPWPRHPPCFWFLMFSSQPSTHPLFMSWDSLSPLNLVIFTRFVIYHRLQGITLHCWISLNELHGWCERDNPWNKYCSRTKTKHRDFLKLAEWLILTEKDKRHIDMRHWSCNFSTTEGSPPSRVTEGFCVTKRWLRYLRTARSQGKTS